MTPPETPTPSETPTTSETPTPSRAPYLCYILAASDGRRTYVGITNNLARRLRQHNGELSGGAKATRAWRPWGLFATITGFRTSTEVLMFEWALHHVRGAGGVAGRRAKLAKVMAKSRWTRRAPLARDVPLHVTFFEPASGGALAVK
jgi:structure-specific endonuclease subunit SLX1